MTAVKKIVKFVSLLLLMAFTFAVGNIVSAKIISGLDKKYIFEKPENRYGIVASDGSMSDFGAMFYGYIGQNGNFVTVLRSNAVTTPREDVSDQVDEEWMMTDEQFKKILQASGANQMFEQIGSQEMVKFLSNNVDSVKNTDLSGSANTSALLSAISSSSMFAGSSSSSPMSGFSK